MWGKIVIKKIKKGAKNIIINLTYGNTSEIINFMFDRQSKTRDAKFKIDVITCVI